MEVLDTRAFERFCKILKGKAPKHIKIISDECNALIEQIKQHDIEAVIFNSHKLKSSTGQIGAKALSISLRDIETLAIEEKDLNHDGEVLVEKMDNLQQLIAQTCSALDEAFVQMNSA
ncbi:MAG TPA: hypothetical protein DHW71_02815 [Gammaproteobacteria bacterium]|nr:hypothetical protein [Gammaproteobacteria bacterium]HBF09484.1 hypothetical protein [Gammaproteobacteria bacterium]HCK91888.1 hypothetical protein [Gammaproteobacteria bacterium]|tara:strand:- start:672 stop:1025 length:354 start_codon:yes stop_codon:yes gene_type:complete